MSTPRPRLQRGRGKTGKAEISVDKLAESRGEIKSFRPGTSSREDSRTSRGRKPGGDFAPPARTRSHYLRILELLRERGPRGVLGSELYARPELYGRSPRNRISELRRDGYRIEGAARGASDWHYKLVEDKPERSQDRPRVTGLPLFDSAARQ